MTKFTDLMDELPKDDGKDDFVEEMKLVKKGCTSCCLVFIGLFTLFGAICIGLVKLCFWIF